MVPEAQREWAKMLEGWRLMAGSRRVVARWRVSVMLAGLRG